MVSSLPWVEPALEAQRPRPGFLSTQYPCLKARGIATLLPRPPGLQDRNPPRGEPAEGFLGAWTRRSECPACDSLLQLPRVQKPSDFIHPVSQTPGARELRGLLSEASGPWASQV